MYAKYKKQDDFWLNAYHNMFWMVFTNISVCKNDRPPGKASVFNEFW